MERIDALPRLWPLALLTQYCLLQCASIVSLPVERYRLVFSIRTCSESRRRTLGGGLAGRLGSPALSWLLTPRIFSC